MLVKKFIQSFVFVTISDNFYSNSETFASELQDNLEEMLSRYYVYSDMFIFVFLYVSVFLPFVLLIVYNYVCIYVCV